MKKTLEWESSNYFPLCFKRFVCNNQKGFGELDARFQYHLLSYLSPTHVSYLSLPSFALKVRNPKGSRCATDDENQRRSPLGNIRDHLDLYVIWQAITGPHSLHCYSRILLQVGVWLPWLDNLCILLGCFIPAVSSEVYIGILSLSLHF